MIQHKAVLVFVLLLANCAGNSLAYAFTSYQKEFVKVYIDPEFPHDTELAKLVNNRKLRCLVCHQGKKKKNCNPYGEHFRELLDQKKDRKNSKKIIAALKKVEQMPSNPDDENSPTYGKLIAAGKLPGGTLEELQKEPDEEE